MDPHIYHSDLDNAPKYERFQISYSTKELTIVYFDGWCTKYIRYRNLKTTLKKISKIYYNMIILLGNVIAKLKVEHTVVKTKL